ncbi:MAG: RdgB/HAM1 family non-canonical purine NTP pyrophosphatase [Coriobacteriales bacterium]|nr:RdgB/HAM1 family non-canonical purine NTP pyrophosphatase [Actinomycetes bacterium]
MPRVIIASTNAGKVAEIRSALSTPGWAFITVEDLGAEPLEVQETGETFLDNARLKAKAYAQHFGMPALADDSGLEVDALRGAPGVRSARYAGEPGDDRANNARLLSEMEGVPEEARTARFRSVVVLAWPQGRELVAGGVCEGRIGFRPVGTHGFGYDPLFLPDATPGRAMAELDLAEKNTISHRGAALRKLHDLLAEECLA